MKEGNIKAFRVQVLQGPLAKDLERLVQDDSRDEVVSKGLELLSYWTATFTDIEFSVQVGF
jgi:hypothetical protein